MRQGSGRRHRASRTRLRSGSGSITPDRDTPRRTLPDSCFTAARTVSRSTPIGIEAIADRVAAVRHPGHRLPAPQRLGPARRLITPRRRDSRQKAQRRRGSRVATQRHRHGSRGEPLGPWCTSSVRTRTSTASPLDLSDNEAGTHVHAGARLGVPAVVPRPHLDARSEPQRVGERVVSRALQPRPQARHRRAGTEFLTALAPQLSSCSATSLPVPAGGRTVAVLD